MLSDRFELFYFDHQGFIENAHLKESAYENLDQIVAEIEAFRVANSLERFILFGHSGHAYMALEYSKTYSDQLFGLILCGCSPDLSNSTHQTALDYFKESADSVRKGIFLNDMSRLGNLIGAEPDLRFIHFALCQKLVRSHERCRLALGRNCYPFTNSGLCLGQAFHNVFSKR